MQFSNPRLAARLFELCQCSLGVEVQQLFAEVLDTNIPELTAIFGEAESIARNQLPSR